MHSLNILHRDISLGNILVHEDGNVKLTGFGQAMVLVGAQKLVYESKFVRVNANLAPEILLKRPHGKSIDWYGVGEMLYELLVGRPPY